MANEVFIDGDSDTIQLRVQGHSTQTYPLQTWEDSTGNILGQITADGRLELGDLDLGTPDALIEANRDITLPSSTPKRGVQSRGLIQRIGQAITDAVAWSVYELELLGDGGVSGLHAALRSKISQKNSGASAQADLRAGDFEAINEEGTSQTPVGKMAGVQSAVTNEDNAHLNEAVGAEIAITNGTDATIQTAYGVRINLPSSASKKYAVHANAGSLHLGDDLELKVFSSTPGDNPPADFIKVYPKLDGSDPKLYAKDSGGTEYELGGVGDHGDLSGLGDDDHTQYLLTSGDRALSGDLNLNGNDVNNAATLLFNEGSVPGTPTANKVVLYAKSDGKVYSKDDAGTEYDLTASAPSAPTGAMMMWTTNTAPTGWLLCAGQSLSMTTYKTLLDVLLTDIAVADLGLVTGVSCTADNTNDTFTATGHGLSNGTVIMFSATTLPAGISSTGRYFVINATTNTFQVSTTQGGAAVNFTSNGSAVLFHTQFKNIDLRGRFPLGQDDMGGTSANRVTDSQADSIGGASGEEKHTLASSEIPSHSHVERAANNQTAYRENGTQDRVRISATGGAAASSETLKTENTGSGDAHNNIPPYLTLNFIIKD